MPQTSRTKILLAKSLQELMSSAPLEKISVNDIVEKAGVGRNTFYYHFEDKYDLVNWYFLTGATKFWANRMTYVSLVEMLDTLEDYFRENRIFYTNAMRYTGQNNLRDYIRDYTRAIFYQRLLELPEASDMTDKELRVTADFFASAFVGVLSQWIEGGMKEHMSDYHSCLQKLFAGSSLYSLIGPATPSPAPQR